MGTKSKRSRKAKEDISSQEDSVKDQSSVTIDTNGSDSTDEESSSAAEPEKKKLGRKRKKHSSNVLNVESIETAEADTVTTVKENSNNVETGNNKSYRKRKKHYFNAIRAQMEFYFGDANLSKDRFLKQLIEKDPFVPLDTFLTFNKMKALTSRVEDIAKSLSNSQLLELDEGQQKVRRKTPLVENRNVDEKTLYVEALPSTADHEWVRQIFERFGKVEYISLPKYAKSHRIKEFGFVEFEKEDSLKKALQAFKEFNGVLQMDEKDPSELISVKSYLKEQSGEELGEEHPKDENRKRNKAEGQSDDAEPKAKKLKTDSQDEDQEEDQGTETEATTSLSESETKDEDTSKKPDENGDEDKESKKKKRRKRKKKSKSEEKLKRKAELNTDVSYYELKILPKKDWKRLRNKYLNLQREKVAELKRKAWREQQEIKQQNKDNVKDENSSQIPNKTQKKKSKESKHKLQKMNMNFYGAAAEEEPPAKILATDKAQQNPALERAPLFGYEPGLIVEMSFLEPCVNIKEYKADMRQYPSVKYIDIKEGAMKAYLRLETAQLAKEFVQKISCAEYQCQILSGETESAYWQKIEKDREQKLNKQVKVPQKRGREKVKKLISKHIRFGDDDDN
ncbi:la-related protein 7 [Musca domestica]|uniref:La-related protein 7 n=1 Tax=Musca domestica TaxID=7370 RepID=A0A9J7I460_MUSDO|nr:la-related protein 7 [Musca domestica]